MDFLRFHCLLDWNGKKTERKPYHSTVIIHVGTNDIFDSNTFELRKLIPSVLNTVATFTHYMVRCTQDKVHEGGNEGNRKESQ